MPAADVYRALWRHRWMIVALTAIAGLAAYAFVQTQPSIYRAEALVRIQQRASTPAEAYGALGSLELGERLAQTYARIVKTRSIHERVSRSLEGRVPGEEISISATPVGDLELLTISADSENPQYAARVANATTVALRTFIRETGTLRDQIVVVDSATPPSVPVLPRTTSTIAIAIMLALLLNCALALSREFFADRLPAIEEWEARFGRPVVATVPNLNLKTRSAILTPAGASAEGNVRVMASEAMTGPTRWSVGRTEIGSGG